MTANKFNSRASQHFSGRSIAPRNVVRLILTLAGLTACFWGVWNSWREGFSQLLASYGAATNQLEAVDRAVRLSPTTPEAHYVRASLLSNKGELAEAVRGMERAVALRPHDYALWLELGRARDQANDTKGALAAFKESVRLAPFYAQPHWQLGNVFYRAGRLDEAFTELRRAVVSNPKFLPQVLNLAWAAFGDDTQAIERALQPQTPSTHLALARLFVRHGKIGEAVRQFRAAGGVSDDERRALLTDLLAAKRFSEAYEVWSSGRLTKGEKTSSGSAVILNGGFEESVSLNDPGFGWQLSQAVKAVQASQDVAEPRAGLRSLRLVWNGNADTASAVVSQLVLVEPRTRYQLRFAARTQEIVSAGRPLIIITDAGSDNEQPLGQSVTLPQGTSGWQDYTIEFAAGDATRAILISVRRQNCNSYPCPIFGRVWLDDFSIQIAKAETGN